MVLLDSVFRYSGVESALKLIGLIILCAIIIAASYFTTRFVGKRQQNASGETNFKSIDVYRLSQNKYLQIIRIGTRYFVIAVSKDSVETIAELKEEELSVLPEDKKVSFKDIMSKVITGRKSASGSSVSDGDTEEKEADHESDYIEEKKE